MDVLNPKGYNGKNKQDNVIPELSFNRSEKIFDYGFRDLPDSYGKDNSNKINTKTFSWVSDIDKNKEEKLVNSTYEQDKVEFNPVARNWDKKTMLGKTQALFNSKGMLNIVSRKGDTSVYASQIQTSVINGAMSKGSAVLQKGMYDTNGYVNTSKSEPEDVFCRAWTTFNRYDTVQKLIRNNQLNHSDAENGNVATIFSDKSKWRLHNSHLFSVLDDNGFPKIAPYKTDNLTRQATLPKKYMFSIENLAWAGAPAVNLLPVEQGPGDLITGKFGRIMWFPPYDLTFSESSAVNLESTNFIGRGEPIYTYNNTERTGNLSFKVIIDHPSIYNAFQDGAVSGSRGPSDEFIASFFAGCVDLDPKWGDYLSKEEINKVEIRRKPKENRTVIPKKLPPGNINIYFPNDITKVETILNGAENVDGSYIAAGYELNSTPDTGVGDYNGEKQPIDAGLKTFKTSPAPKRKDNLTKWPDKTNFKLNGSGQELKIPTNPTPYTNGWNDPTYINDLRAYLQNECPKCKAVSTGYASSQGTSFANKELAKKRAESMKKWMIDNNIIEEGRIKINATGSKTLSGKYTEETDVDQKDVKEDRYASIIFENEAKDEECIDITYEDEVIPNQLNAQVKKRFYSESDFFEKLEKTDKFVFDNIRTKIRYFHPAFHSTTPEGFNSRLTFLLQCTRQGATIPGTEARNLAFGPQPVCILRIGDFYNTKIMIDNVSFDFEPLVWDLNPEGVGVQPMIANVSMSFKYIGGSSLVSPINKLQNALSFNYFANNQVFDPRADIVARVSSFSVTEKERLEKLGIKEKRNTFELDYNKFQSAQKEDNYILVNGLDPTTQSLGSLNSVSEVDGTTDKPVDQTATADKTGTGQPPANNQFKDITLVSNDFYEPPIKSKPMFEPYFKWPANIKFNEDYVVSGTLVNDNKPTETYTITILNKVTAAPVNDSLGEESNKLEVTVQQGVIPDMDGNPKFYSQSFLVVGEKMTPKFTGFTSGDSYTFTTVIKNSTEEGKFTTKFSSSSATTSGTSAVGGELKITGVEIIQVSTAGDYAENNKYPNVVGVRLGVKNENIYDVKGMGGGYTEFKPIATEEQINDFIKKGIKIVVEQTPTPSSDGDKRWEELVRENPTYSPTLETDNNPNSSTFGMQYKKCVTNCDNGTKNLEALCSGTFFLGNLVTQQFGQPRIERLLDGNYTLSVFVANQRVASTNLTVGNSNPSAPSEFSDEFMINQLSVENLLYNPNLDVLYIDLRFSSKQKSPDEGGSLGGNSNKILKLSKNHTANIIIESGSTKTKIGTIKISKYNSIVYQGIQIVTKGVDSGCGPGWEINDNGEIKDNEINKTYQLNLSQCDDEGPEGLLMLNAWNKPGVTFAIEWDTGTRYNRNYSG
jgi:hypothetical protein